MQAAKLGKRVAVVEQQPCVGGVCVDTGTIPSKTLREAVLTFSGLAGRATGAVGPHRQRGPPRSSSSPGVDEVVAREIDVIENQLRRNDVTPGAGEASFVDPHTLVVRSDDGGRTITADHVADRRRHAAGAARRA